jgi:hypothetical protein
MHGLRGRYRLPIRAHVIPAMYAYYPARDDDYEYQQTKRAYHRNVAFMISGVLCTVGLLVVRFALRRERSYPTPVYIPPTVPTARALPIPRDPIEFELVVGSDKYDVIPDKIVDVKGTLVTFEQNPTRARRSARRSSTSPPMRKPPSQQRYRSLRPCTDRS